MARDFIDVRLTLAQFWRLRPNFRSVPTSFSTAVAPSWKAIGKLAAITVIRTALSRDMQEEGTGAVSPQGLSP
jgi:uncharacterized membrane protein